MDVRIGTSGYSYKEWKGHFYPEDLPASRMLHFYAERFRTVEINNTFYRMPERKTLEQWLAQVPPGFRFVLKAPQRITHRKRLAETDGDVKYLFEVAEVLGESLGPTLFQLPPYFRNDIPRLTKFLDTLPPDRPVALEFRHESWFSAEVFAVLRIHGAALCIAETDETQELHLVPTANWGYLRLRRTEYGAGDLQKWSEQIKAQPWEQCYVFFKHEDEGKGPQFAAAFASTMASSGTALAGV